MKTIISNLFILSIALLAFLVTGCIDLKQDIWINEDGSGKLVFDVGLTKQFKAMMDLGGGFGDLEAETENGEDSDSNQFWKSPEKVIEKLKESKHVIDAEFKELSDSKFERVIYTIELSDITKINQVMESSSLSSGVEELGGDASSENNDLSITKTESGTFKLNAFMEGNKEESVDPAGDEFGMMQKMFEDSGMSIRVHAPAVSHNGKKKGGAVLWKITLADMAAGKSLIANGEFRGGKSSGNSLLIVGVSVLGIIIILGIVVLFRKKNNQ
jgi:hypothetical protein